MHVRVCCIENEAKPPAAASKPCLAPSDCVHNFRYDRSHIWHARGIKETGGGGGGVGVGWRDPFVIEASPLQFDLLPVNVPGIAAARLKKIGFRGGGAG